MLARYGGVRIPWGAIQGYECYRFVTKRGESVETPISVVDRDLQDEVGATQALPPQGGRGRRLWADQGAQPKRPRRATRD